MLDSLAAQIAVLDSSGNIILVNEAWKRFASEQACFCIARTTPGINYLEVCRKAGPSGAEVFEGIQSVLKGSSPSFSRDFTCHSGKELHWFLLSVTRVGGGRSGGIVSRTDITGQKRAEAALAHLAAIVESSNSAITAAALDGIVMSWNKGAEDLYGYSAAEMVGRSVRMIVPRNRRHELEQALERIRNGESVEMFETVRRCKDGRLIPVALIVSAIKDRRGTIVGVSGIARDVSERRQLEAEVLRVSEREQRSIAQDLHDSLSPQVTGIACFANVLRDHLSKEHSPHAPAAEKIVALLNHTAAQARSLARGLYPVPPEPTGLMSALHELAKRTIELFQVDCTFECPRPVLLKDTTMANHLYRIAQEAVTNAIRHGSPKHIQMILSEIETRVMLAVRDDGKGIRISKRGGKGIGLRIMHYRANLISGTLVVQHASGGGTEILCTVDRENHGTTDKTTTT